ncbi:MAG TPA: dTMP kinase [Actinomycetota bacterium]|nr:dTMP kinase [Actinomycetota bacterium]
MSAGFPPNAMFLVVEGGDGAGKSTQVERLASFLRDAGRDPVVTREPGGTAVGAAIRDLLLDPANGGLSPRAEALLYAADRAQHVLEVIRPALEAGRVVISDRYLDSSLAYQGLARGLGVGEIEDISRWATGGLLPDLVILLDVAAPEGRRRLSGADRAADRMADRMAGADRIEQEGDAFHAKVANAYWALSRAYPERFAVVDGGGSPDEVAAAIRRHVEKLL